MSGVTSVCCLLSRLTQYFLLPLVRHDVIELGVVLGIVLGRDNNAAGIAVVKTVNVVDIACVDLAVERLDGRFQFVVDQSLILRGERRAVGKRKNFSASSISCQFNPNTNLPVQVGKERVLAHVTGATRTVA